MKTLCAGSSSSPPINLHKPLFFNNPLSSENVSFLEKYPSEQYFRRPFPFRKHAIPTKRHWIDHLQQQDSRTRCSFIVSYNTLWWWIWTLNFFNIFKMPSCRLWTGSNINSANNSGIVPLNPNLVHSGTEYFWDKDIGDNFSFASPTTFLLSLPLLFWNCLSCPY